MVMTIRTSSGVSLVGALLGVALLGACDGGEPPVGDDDLALDGARGLTVAERERRACAAERAARARELEDALDVAANDPTISTDPYSTLLLQTADGRHFTHSTTVVSTEPPHDGGPGPIGNPSTPTTSYRSASTSKLVTAVVILDLVDQGVLSLETTVQELLPFWRHPRPVTLRDLLSFTSGVDIEHDCINERSGVIEDCVKKIYDANFPAGGPPPPRPGTRFTYANTHLQIAGLMAIKAVRARPPTEATEVRTWNDVFGLWKERTTLFPNSVYDLPKPENPRLAGGMHWTGADYLEFLDRLQRGTLLSDASRDALFANQRGEATVRQTPVQRAIHEDWSYGLGNWLECRTELGEAFDCEAGQRNSSPGAYGAYPFIDFDKRYVGVLAREGGERTFHEGVAMFRAVEDKVTAWVEHRCRP